MKQLKLDFFQPSAGTEGGKKAQLPAKDTLEQYIKVCGLVAYKDFFLKIKADLVTVPEGLTKSQYLTLAREVYESRAAKVHRPKPVDAKAARAKFFAIKNANRKRGEK